VREQDEQVARVDWTAMLLVELSGECAQRRPCAVQECIREADTRERRLSCIRVGANPALGTGEHADDLVAELLRVDVEFEQDTDGRALVLVRQTQQDVLGADVVVPKRECLSQSQL